jgi:hypothetical protein
MNLAPLWIKGENPHLCIPSGKRGEITERGEGVRQSSSVNYLRTQQQQATSNNKSLTKKKSNTLG